MQKTLSNGKQHLLNFISVFFIEFNFNTKKKDTKMKAQKLCFYKTVVTQLLRKHQVKYGKNEQ